MSDATAWQNIFLAHHRQPAWEMPENHLSQHILRINIGVTRKIERVINGRLQREQFFPGNIAIYRANVDYILRWESESEFLRLGLEPGLLAQTATEILATELLN